MRLRREELHCLVVIDRRGSPLGHVDFEVFRALDDGRTAKIGLFAVDPKIQGKGIGKILLSQAVKALKSKGTERVIVDSAAGREGFYMRLGLKIQDRWAVITTIINALPQVLPFIERF